MRQKLEKRVKGGLDMAELPNVPFHVCGVRFAGGLYGRWEGGVSDMQFRE